MKKFYALPALLLIFGLFSCTAIKDEVVVDPTVPIIEFNPKEADADGIPEYYLFDDNPEHLNSRFLADGDEPSSIAHFSDLTEGIYTVFSYHHRGYSVGFDEDLYYDTVFSSSNGGSFKILSIGLDHDWDWNQAWADYTNTSVQMPEYLRTFNCTCGRCKSGDGYINPDCPSVIRGESREPKTAEFDSLNKNFRISGGEMYCLSEIEGRIAREGINHFRFGGYNEPMWLMMRFQVTNGTVDFDTVAYRDINDAKAKFSSRHKGPFDNEPQYKGIAANAPEVTAEINIEINDATPSGVMPVTVKNMRVPNGYTIPDGVFATNVNTWREERPISVESDLMELEYRDKTKLQLYGENADAIDDVWRFDAYHTKLYGGYKNRDKRILKRYGAEVGDRFVPNGEMSQLKYPTGGEPATDRFYSYTACNLGNFGVTDVYDINAVNRGADSRLLTFEIKSIAGQVYRYSQTDSRGREVISSGGAYIMKKFDDDPAEDLNSDAEPKERIKPAEYGDQIRFVLEPNEQYSIRVEVTTLTGCVAPMHNRFVID